MKPITQFFRNKPVDPMCDKRQVRKLLDELAAEAPQDALGEITFMLQSVSDAENCGIDVRMEVITLLDEAGQSFQRKLAQEYLGSSRMPMQQEGRLWLLITGFSKQLASAYLHCLDACMEFDKVESQAAKSRPVLAVRAMRALGAQCKWLRIRYRVPDEGLWREMYRLYQLAESGQYARTLISAYAQATQTSVQQEFLRCLMLESSAPDNLTPPQIELLDRLISLYASSFVMSADAAEGTCFIDLETGKPPLRKIARLPASDKLRFFGAGSAAQKVMALLQQVEKGTVPSEIGKGDPDAKEALLLLLPHALLNWSKNVPQRKHERKHAVTRLSIAHGLDSIRHKVATATENGNSSLHSDNDLHYQERMDLQMYGFVTEKTKKAVAESASWEIGIAATSGISTHRDSDESWVMENVSACGFGAILSQLPEDWLKMGILIGLRMGDKKEWSVGVVRRLTRDASMKVYIGIQSLSHAPLSVRLKPVDLAVSVWDLAHDGGTHDLSNVTGILVRSGGCMDQDCLLLQPGIFKSHKVFDMVGTGEKHRVRLTGVLEQGTDFERVAFSRMDQGEA